MKSFKLARFSVLLVILTGVIVLAAIRLWRHDPPPLSAQETFTPGYYHLSLPYDDETRTFWLFISDTYDSRTPLPLVVGLHGGTGTGRQFEKTANMNAAANALDFIAVYPDGTGRLQTWNAGHCCGTALRRQVDDVGFIRALVGALQDDLVIDPARIYVTGMSNGGMMAYRLAAEASDIFAAAAPVSGSIGGTFQPGWTPFTNLPQGDPVSILAIHGMEDTSVRYAGGVSDGLFGNDRIDLSATESISTWVTHDQCDPDPVRATSYEELVITDTYTCPAGVSVMLISIVDGQHTWPGGDQPRLLRANSTPYFDASEVILRFFLDHPKRAP